jgi:DNA-binding NarL/FixJ family response regulator
MANAGNLAMIRAVIVDEHPIARFGLIEMLRPIIDISVVASASDEQGLASANETKIDIVVCDPYANGGDPTPDIVRALSRIAPVLVSSSQSSPSRVLTAQQAGAMGYLTKNADLDVYEMAIRTVVSGRTYLDPQVSAGWSTESFRRHGLNGVTSLSQRERQVLVMIARGLTHHQIANRLGVSRATVETYVARVRSKLQLGNKAELAIAALIYGWDTSSTRTPNHRSVELTAATVQAGEGALHLLPPPTNDVQQA